MTLPHQDEHIEYWTHPIHKEVELSRAHLNSFSFEKHIHLDYHIGVVSQGVQEYLHKGTHYQLTPNNISILNPDECHNGHSLHADGYHVHVMSLPCSLVEEIATEVGVSALFFQTPIINSQVLQRQFLLLHTLLTTERQRLSRLEAETTLLALVTELFGHYGQSPKLIQPSAKLGIMQLSRVKQLLHEHLASDINLEQLSSSVDLSKFQFLRQFKTAMGMTPHAYLTRLRLEYAKKSLRNGNSAINTAYEVGFFDQSHFNKAFKRAYLVTPSDFKKRVI
ncbi:AraC family transcriptional regulator [Shewanella colwelliana]|uniref:AraC family transcriptional regulator n=1 Tax=Shewanella colwelliana TaxID=23 RepID=UPI00299D3CF0|nr:AraC family transcriptional regulator [Shewanella colwelliana]MDX1282442.1 AraC family transcriptional regulator [Shewanella colwelliana]